MIFHLMYHLKTIYNEFTMIFYESIFIILSCSIIFVCFPFFYEHIPSFFIYSFFETRESPKFSNWFKHNSKFVAIIITLFNSGNVI